MINIRIKILVLLILSIFGLIIAAYPQTNLSISGFVTDEPNSNPVQNHLVIVAIDSAGIINDYLYFTNDAGYYESDTIYAPNQGTVLVSVFDCFENEHTQEAFFNPNNSNFVFDFTICTEIMPPDCENSFVYETEDSLTFIFFGFAEPDPTNFYYWDFGDGSSGEGQQVSHTYPGGINTYYIVILTTLFIDPSTQDSCFAESIEFVWTGNSTNCIADFMYESEPASNTTINFFDLSTGSPTSWLWDFGDGTFSEEQNPVHTYLIEGLYQVCLLIQDNSDLCFDSYCQEIIVGDSTGYFISISGFVMDSELFFPVPDHEVYVNIDSNNIFPGYNSILTTDEMGFYIDSIAIPLELLEGSINVGTFDCFAEFIEEELLFNPDNNSLFYDFVICSDSINYECDADFDFSEDPANPFTYFFFNNSVGNITQYFWDFGDGNYSYEQNPIHSFNSTGVFSVCLSILSDTAGYFCSDTICQLISADYSLTANFDYYLDSISDNERYFSFADVSVGNPDSFLWKFGDGSTSSIQNPEHEYAEAGEYTVCLLIERNFPGGNSITDSICKTILAPEYFDFGGQVFLGGFPLNNPVHEGDTGVAYLYRKYSNAIVATDTNLFFEFGYYLFPDTREGDYIIKVSLTENSTHYPDYFQSYHENSLYWNEAQVFQLIDTGNYYTNVNLRELEGAGSGSGSISGTINIDEGCSSSFSEDNVVVMLLDENGNLFSFTVTDENGYFSFSNLEANIYQLYAEETALFTSAQDVVLNDNNMLISGIELFLNCDGTVGIENFIDGEIVISEIFPNPVDNDINVNIELDKASSLTAKVFDITGRIIADQMFSLTKGEKKINLSASQLPKGVYVLSLYFSEDGQTILKKFVK